jgi:hypothetical protein
MEQTRMRRGMARGELILTDAEGCVNLEGSIDTHAVITAAREAQARPRGTVVGNVTRKMYTLIKQGSYGVHVMNAAQRHVTADAADAHSLVWRRTCHGAIGNFCGWGVPVRGHDLLPVAVASRHQTIDLQITPKTALSRGGPSGLAGARKLTVDVRKALLDWGFNAKAAESLSMCMAQSRHEPDRTDLRYPLTYVWCSIFDAAVSAELRDNPVPDMRGADYDNQYGLVVAQAVAQSGELSQAAVNFSSNNYMSLFAGSPQEMKVLRIMERLRGVFGARVSLPLTNSQRNPWVRRSSSLQFQVWNFVSIYGQHTGIRTADHIRDYDVTLDDLTRQHSMLVEGMSSLCRRYGCLGQLAEAYETALSLSFGSYLPLTPEGNNHSHLACSSHFQFGDIPLPAPFTPLLDMHACHLASGSLLAARPESSSNDKDSEPLKTVPGQSGEDRLAADAVQDVVSETAFLYTGSQHGANLVNLAWAATAVTMSCYYTFLAVVGGSWAMLRGACSPGATDWGPLARDVLSMDPTTRRSLLDDGAYILLNDLFGLVWSDHVRPIRWSEGFALLPLEVSLRLGLGVVDTIGAGAHMSGWLDQMVQYPDTFCLSPTRATSNLSQCVRRTMRNAVSHLVFDLRWMYEDDLWLRQLQEKTTVLNVRMLAELQAFISAVVAITRWHLANRTNTNLMNVTPNAAGDFPNIVIPEDWNEFTVDCLNHDTLIEHLQFRPIRYEAPSRVVYDPPGDRPDWINFSVCGDNGVLDAGTVRFTRPHSFENVIYTPHLALTEWPLECCIALGRQTMAGTDNTTQMPQAFWLEYTRDYMHNPTSEGLLKPWKATVLDLNPNGRLDPEESLLASVMGGHLDEEDGPVDPDADALPTIPRGRIQDDRPIGSLPSHFTMPPPSSAASEDGARGASQAESNLPFDISDEVHGGRRYSGNAPGRGRAIKIQMKHSSRAPGKQEAGATSAPPRPGQRDSLSDVQKTMLEAMVYAKEHGLDQDVVAAKTLELYNIYPHSQAPRRSQTKAGPSLTSSLPTITEAAMGKSDAKPPRDDVLTGIVEDLMARFPLGTSKPKPAPSTTSTTASSEAVEPPAASSSGSMSTTADVHARPREESEEEEPAETASENP